MKINSVIHFLELCLIVVIPCKCEGMGNGCLIWFKISEIQLLLKLYEDVVEALGGIGETEELYLRSKESFKGNRDGTTIMMTL